MAICVRNNTTPAIEIEYLSGCSQKSQIPNFVLAPELQTGYPLYSDINDIGNGWHILLPKEAHNLVKNPVFFNDLDEWDSANSQLTRTNLNSFDSGFSGLIRGSGDTVTLDRRAYIETEAEGFEPGQTYVFSAYLWMPQLFDSQDITMGTISIVDNDGITEEEVFSQPLERFGKWVRVAVSKTIRTSATSVLLRVNLRSQDQRELTPPYNLTGDFNLQSEYLFADMLQFEGGTTPTTPFHGDTGTCCSGGCGGGGNCCEGYKWLGGPHRSISHRSDCTRDGGELASLASLGFEILEHTGHGAPPVRDIFYDYTNRPGGKHQKTVVDTNVLTLVGYICEKSLKELECEIFGIQSVVFPDLSSCNRGMLLVYVHESCDKADCDPERYLAYCVTYIGGLEGLRNNLFQQRLALQFRAHDPFPFEWPGQTAHALEFDTITSGAAVVKVGLDEIRSYGIDADGYNTIACVGEQDKFIVGGDNGATIHDCEEICELEMIGGTVNASATDEAGNIIIGGSFLAPFQRLAIYHPDTDDWAGFNYSGGDVLSLLAPFFAEVVVGATDGVYIILSDSELFYATDGPVNAIAMTIDGTLYAFGDFTTIDGVAASNAAKLDINSEGCLDLENAQWEGLGFSLNGAVTTATADGDTIYIGGDFTEATPDAIATCDVINGDKSESKGGNQIVSFQDDTPAVGQVTIRFEINSVVAREIYKRCQATADPIRMVRITAKSIAGHSYNLLFTEESIVSVDFTGITEYNCGIITTDISEDATADSTPVGTNTITMTTTPSAISIETQIINAQAIETQQIANGQTVTDFVISTDVGDYTFPPSAFLSRAAAILTFDDTLIIEWPFDGTIEVNEVSYETLSNCSTTLYNAEMAIDKTFVLTTGSCPQDNELLVDDIAESIELAQVYAGLNYASGLGLDNSLNSVVFQCVQRVESYQGESTTLNHVAAINGDTISALGDGLTATPNVLFVNPDTGELLAGTNEGILVWTGREWTEYQGLFGNPCESQPVIDMAYCSGSLYVLYEGEGHSLLSGMSNINYLGGVDTFDFELMIHGPGKIRSLTHCDKTMRFCTELQCGEVATLDFNSGSFKSGDRDLSSSVLGGSRYDMMLSRCENPLKLLITDSEASTKATLIYKRQYVGIEALCCSDASRYAGTAKLLEEMGLGLDACCSAFNVAARDPSLDDCAGEGYKEGDLWLNAAGTCIPGGSSCARLYVNIENECCDPSTGAYQLIDTDGEILLDVEGGDPLCPEEVV